ncbi:diacylglycerol kinase family protein [Nitrosovibrio sp. Nv17]|uniref:diacylglycerol/lipid kinase family protein n=1 Tax=Nitrosovibrio sp. Nv17 TaxID=1855339 RepID=UPI000908E8A7|nr:diacylglycerol kinase family protein [Nitrosovibrio sp. Nv17]SFW11147.1 Diacylglycerol kinase family enzyme [Nitrosovibrio sp. Nv17]
MEPSHLDNLEAGTATVGILFNPLGGRIRKREHSIRDELERIPRAICRRASDAPAIREAIDAFLVARVDVLLVVGGDGTVQATLSRLFEQRPAEEWPVLAIVPGGTTNMTALDLGMHGKPEMVLRELRTRLSAQIPPRLMKRHILCIEQPGAGKIYGMFFGLGLIARAVIFSRGSIKRLGITGEGYSALITVGYFLGILLGRRKGAWAPAHLSIRHEQGEFLHETCPFLFASTLDRLLFGMRPYWGREAAPLHVTFVRQQCRRPLRALWRVLAGRGEILREVEGYHSFNSATLELLVDDDYIVDGESYRASSAHGPLRVGAAGPATFLGIDAGTPMPSSPVPPSP